MVHQRITAKMREEIQTGKFPLGAQFPSTRELARTWKTSVFTIHTALKVLVKEGWIERRNGAGTFIADPRNRFVRAGIYQRGDVGPDEQIAFIRGLHMALLKQLDALGKETQYFIDSQPAEKHDPILPSLAEAIRDRSIQCVFVPSINDDDNGRALAELPVPTAFVFNPFSLNQAILDEDDLLRESVRHLAAQGCRSVGIISTWGADAEFYKSFRRIISEEGLVTHTNWVRAPLQSTTPSQERHGYEEFKNLWRLSKRPDGLIVYPDGVARGCILAALEIGTASVPITTKFVLHGNASARFFCPFDVTWALTDEAAVARAMIELVQKQFEGKETCPVKIPFLFENTKTA